MRFAHRHAAGLFLAAAALFCHPVSAASGEIFFCCPPHPNNSAERVLTTADLIPSYVPSSGGQTPGPEPDDEASGPPADETPAQALEVTGQHDRYDLPLGIIGETEMVFIEDIPQPFSARIDTGAATCSIDAGDVEYFERDGRPWVSFSLEHRETGESHKFEKRILRSISIKTIGEETQRRPIVEMAMRLGTVQVRREFTLNDRGNYEHQVLVGRNFLNGMAAVDVARAFSVPYEDESGDDEEE